MDVAVAPPESPLGLMIAKPFVLKSTGCPESGWMHGKLCHSHNRLCVHYDRPVGVVWGGTPLPPDNNKSWTHTSK